MNHLSALCSCAVVLPVLSAWLLSICQRYRDHRCVCVAVCVCLCVGVMLRCTISWFRNGVSLQCKRPLYSQWEQNESLLTAQINLLTFLLSEVFFCLLKVAFVIVKSFSKHFYTKQFTEYLYRQSYCINVGSLLIKKRITINKIITILIENLKDQILILRSAKDDINLWDILFLSLSD